MEDRESFHAEVQRTPRRIKKNFITNHTNQHEREVLEYTHAETLRRREK